jgi:hypothetical protein
MHTVKKKLNALLITTASTEVDISIDLAKKFQSTALLATIPPKQTIFSV